MSKEAYESIVMKCIDGWSKKIELNPHDYFAVEKRGDCYVNLVLMRRKIKVKSVSQEIELLTLAKSDYDCVKDSYKGSVMNFDVKNIEAESAKEIQLDKKRNAVAKDISNLLQSEKRKMMVPTYIDDYGNILSIGKNFFIVTAERKTFLERVEESSKDSQNQPYSAGR
jgi:hypothetical protein